MYIYSSFFCTLYPCIMVFYVTYCFSSSTLRAMTIYLANRADSDFKVTYLFNKNNNVFELFSQQMSQIKQWILVSLTYL